jgi:hypothetical protein
MTLTHLSPAGVRAGNAALYLNSGQQKTLLIAGQGYHFVRAVEASGIVSTALRITPNQTFGAIRHETIQ